MDAANAISVTVTREFEWNVEKINYYLLSEVFDIFMENSSTIW